MNESREAALLLEAGAAAVSDMSLRRLETTLVAAYARGSVRCAYAEVEGAPGEHYARLPGALRSPLMFAPAGAAPALSTTRTSGRWGRLPPRPAMGGWPPS